MVTYNSSLFSHDPQTKSLIAEASTLQLRSFDRLYNDSCDIGIEFRNEKTNVLSKWFLEETVYSNGEIVEWILKPCGSNLNKKQIGYQMIILND